ncbi:MAG: ATP-binding protein [Nitrospiraceae bacterium]
MSPIQSQPSAASQARTAGFLGLRTKFVVFFSLIIIATCSGLSWYFIYTKQATMTQQLTNIGRILVMNLTFNPRVRFAIATEDLLTLTEFVDGALAVEDVVYVTISDSDGNPLVRKTKGAFADSAHRVRSPEPPLFPDPALAPRLVQVSTTEPILSYMVVQKGAAPQARLAERGNPLLPSAIGSESIYDFALPVTKPSDRDALRTGSSLESQESLTPPSKAPSTPRVYGLVQVGLSESRLTQALMEAVRTSAILTLLIILAGIIGTILLTNRIVTPLQSLAAIARRISGGDLSTTVPPTTSDEIGELTTTFNSMTQSLKDRDQAISRNLETISRQVRQLTTLNQAGAVITSTLDLDRLLSTVLQLLTENLGFARMALFFYDRETGTARLARTSGIPEDLVRLGMQIDMPVRDADTVRGETLIHGKPLLIQDIETGSERIYPPLLELLRRSHIRSFVVAPLRTQERILGFLGGDRGETRCTQEDLDLLTTVASHVAVAIDNARTYHQLEGLTESLDHRVRERTQELLAANERLTELDKLRSAFVSIVSHELRTPMTAIRGYVDNMLDGLTGPLTDKQGHYLNRVKFNADRLTHMIAELLDLSRIEAGRVEVHWSTVNLAELVEEVADDLRRPASERDLVIETRSVGSNLVVRGDRDKLHQIVTNLVGNASKFTPRGGRITVETSLVEPEQVQISVADTGCGIPPDELPKVFERFFRGGAVPPEARGAGLGLSIVKSLVELHRGSVTVESQVGVGTTFFITLPINQPEQSKPGRRE